MINRRNEMPLEQELEQNSMELDETPFSLSDFANEIHFGIANQTPYDEETKIMRTLFMTSKRFSFFGEELEKRASNQLGKYIEDADIVKVEAMVKANPRLLLRPIEAIVNPETGQIIEEMTPLQAAYCEGDDGMCLMLEKYFELACGSVEAGRDKIRKQINEKFGEGKDEDKESEGVRKNRLAAIIQAITKEQFNNGRDADKKWILSEATQMDIATFIEEFIASQPKVIKSGRRFRLEILQEVCEAYIEAARLWNYDYKKCALFEDASVTVVLGYAAVNDAQRFSQGLYYLQERGEEFKRRSTTRDGHNFYQALRGKSSVFSSLSGSCVDIVPLRSHRARASPGGRARLQNLCRAKTSNLENLCSHANERKRLGA